MTNDRKIVLMLLNRARKARKNYRLYEFGGDFFIDEITDAAVTAHWCEALHAYLSAKRIICDAGKND